MIIRHFANIIIGVTKPLTLSIVIPAYNEEGYIKACLDSISKQTVSPDEVIVVDNNSTDNTAAIAKQYAFVKIITEQKQGKAHARNTGFYASSSKLIGRIDADTLLPVDWVDQVKTFYSNPANNLTSLTGGTYFYNWPLKNLMHLIHWTAYFSLNKIILGYPNLFGSNMVLPKKVWQAIADSVCIDDKLHEDIDLSIHINKSGLKIFSLHGLNVCSALRGPLYQRNESKHRFSMWKDTLKAHASWR